MNDPELPQPIIFEWDIGNLRKNLEKHGITQQEAEDAFFHFKLIVPDQRHSKTEPRFGMYGQANTGKNLFIAFTIRNQRVRVISARPVNKKERILYEKTKKIA